MSAGLSYPHPRAKAWYEPRPGVGGAWWLYHTVGRLLVIQPKLSIEELKDYKTPDSIPTEVYYLDTEVGGRSQEAIEAFLTRKYNLKEDV